MTPLSHPDGRLRELIAKWRMDGGALSMIGSHNCADELEALLAAVPVEEATPPLWRALKYWEAKKLALDAVRPDFTTDQLRELNAAEGRLLAAIYVASPGPVAGAVRDLTVGEAAMPVEVLRWIVNVARGVGRAGGLPDSGEWEAALEAGRVALMRDVLGPKVAGAVPAPPKHAYCYITHRGEPCAAPFCRLEPNHHLHEGTWTKVPPRSEQDETQVQA